MSALTEPEKLGLALEIAQDAVRYAIEYIDVAEAVSDHYALRDLPLDDDEIDAVAREVHDLAMSLEVVVPDDIYG